MNKENESPGNKLRKRLFDLYSKNLTVVKKNPRIKIEPDEDDLYLCPICMKLFPREVLSISEDSDEYLTLEDVPPDALGGNIRLLTCKKCNNFGGTQLEKHLVNKLNFEEAIQGSVNTSIDGKFVLNEDTELTTTFTLLGNNGIYAETHKDRSNPKNVNRILAMANSKEDIGRFSIKLFGNYRQSRPEIALIRIAYLLAYSTFGFGFLVNFNLQLIRDQIQSPRKKILEHWGILQMDFPDDNLGINIITEQKELQSFLIVFDLKTDNSVIRYGVLLPGPTKPGIEIYKWLMLPENQRNIEFCAKKIPDDDYLKNPKLAFASLEYWNSVR